MDKNNQYTIMQKNHYENQASNMIGNHSGHNSNPDYWNILLRYPKENIDKIKKETAFDFGFGHGRNLINLKKLGFKIVDGADISTNNYIYAEKNIETEFNSTKDFGLYVNNGIDLEDVKSDYYNFVMSTIVFQHICVYSIRKNLLKEIYRILKKKGIFSFQIGYDPNRKLKENFSDYYEDKVDAEGTNGANDFTINDYNYIRKDLEDIGFKNINFEIRNSWEDSGHEKWLFIECSK